jgi:hypothetical protein
MTMLAAAALPLHSRDDAAARRPFGVVGDVGKEGGEARVSESRGDDPALQQLGAFPCDRLEREGARSGIACLLHESDGPELGEVLGGRAPAVARRRRGVCILTAGEHRRAAQRAEGAELGDERRDGGVLAHARQPDEVRPNRGIDMRPRGAQLSQRMRAALHQYVAVLADGIAHPRELDEARDALGNERPHHDEASGTPPGDDGELLTAAFTQVVVTPVPIPIERLEGLLAAAGAIEERVPVRREGIESGAGGDYLEAVRLRGGTGFSGNGKRAQSSTCSRGMSSRNLRTAPDAEFIRASEVCTTEDAAPDVRSAEQAACHGKC